MECVRSADVLKPAKAAADELAALMSGTQPNQKSVAIVLTYHLHRVTGTYYLRRDLVGSDSILALAVSSISQGDVAEQLLKLCGSKLVAMTNGDQDCVIANSNHVSHSTASPHS